MIGELKDSKMYNWIPVRHLHNLSIEDWDKEFSEDIIIDHDMGVVTFRLNEGNKKAMAAAMCEVAKDLVHD